MPGSRYSTGSSTVMMLRSGVFSRLSVEYSVVDLPEPVGPVTRIVPYGLVYDASNRVERLGQEAEVLEPEHRLALVEDAHDDLLAVHGRQGRDAQVDAAAADLHRDAAVLRDAALGDVDVGHDLEARDHARLDAARRAHHLVEHAVDAEPDAQVGLVRLDVDVARAVADGLVHEQVDELDDRRVLDDLRQPREIGLLVGLVGRGLHELVDLGVDWRKNRSIVSMIWLAVATTVRTSAPASARMSSTAKTFDGSAIATTSLPSSQPTGIAW